MNNAVHIPEPLNKAFFLARSAYSRMFSCHFFALLKGTVDF